MKKEGHSRHRPGRKMLVLTLISYVGNVAVIFGYFYPLNPTGAMIYSGWLTLGYVLGWLGLPKVADATDWARLLRKKRQKTQEREDLDKQSNGQLDD